MLRFAVYDKGGPATAWPLVGAHLLGPEDLATKGKIAFERGEIRCRKQASHTVALCLQYDAGAAGLLMLQTCLLPDREEPYMLSLELARHRIKTFIAKSEEWQMFDLSIEHPAMQLWEDARRLFTDAMNHHDALEADGFARQSLVKGIEATERLAMAHAEILLHRRYANKPASSATLGVRVWPGRDAPAIRELITRDFDVVSLPLRWNELEVEEGVYRWEPLDQWISWAQTQGKPVVLGPLLDFSKRSLPKWMYVWQHDYDTCRDLAYDFIEKIVKRYKGAVGLWNLASGLNVNDNFTFTAAQMMDLARMASLLVRQSHKTARTMIELAQPFGEHVAQRPDSLPPLSFVDRLVQEGIQFHCLGVQLLFGQSEAGRSARDLMQISAMLDRFFLLEIPVIISAVGVPSVSAGEGGGYWQEPWSNETQSRWATRMFAIALSKPHIESVFWGELFDHPASDAPNAGLISGDGKAKPAYLKLTGARKRLRKPLGPLTLPNKTRTETPS